MLTRMFITSKNKYNKKIENAIKKINKLTANPETSFKFDAERFKEIELFVYGQLTNYLQASMGTQIVLER